MLESTESGKYKALLLQLDSLCGRAMQRPFLPHFTWLPTKSRLCNDSYKFFSFAQVGFRCPQCINIQNTLIYYFLSHDIFINKIFKYTWQMCSFTPTLPCLQYLMNSRAMVATLLYTTSHWGIRCLQWGKAWKITGASKVWKLYFHKIITMYYQSYDCTFIWNWFLWLISCRFPPPPRDEINVF